MFYGLRAFSREIFDLAVFFLFSQKINAQIRNEDYKEKKKSWGSPLFKRLFPKFRRIGYSLKQTHFLTFGYF